MFKACGVDDAYPSGPRRGPTSTPNSGTLRGTGLCLPLCYAPGFVDLCVGEPWGLGAGRCPTVPVCVDPLSTVGQRFSALQTEELEGGVQLRPASGTRAGKPCRLSKEAIETGPGSPASAFDSLWTAPRGKKGHRRDPWRRYVRTWSVVQSTSIVEHRKIARTYPYIRFGVTVLYFSGVSWHSPLKGWLTTLRMRFLQRSVLWVALGLVLCSAPLRR